MSVCRAAGGMRIIVANAGGTGPAGANRFRVRATAAAASESQGSPAKYVQVLRHEVGELLRAIRRSVSFQLADSTEVNMSAAGEKAQGRARAVTSHR